MSARDRLLTLFHEGLAVVEPRAAVRRALSREGSAIRIAGRSEAHRGKIHLLACGKAALPMLRASHEICDDQFRRGLAVLPEESEVPKGCVARVASHPLPDQSSADAGTAARSFVAEVPVEDLLLVLLSGGSSALLASPLEDLSVDDLRAATDWLLASGLDISAQNAVRKHLGRCGGGRLAALRPRGQTAVLAISDVIGDDPAVIGSGPFSPDPSTVETALEVIRATPSAGAFPPACMNRLEARAADVETPKPGDSCFRGVTYEVIARNRDLLDGVAAAASRTGLRSQTVTEPFRGSAVALGRRVAGLARAARSETLWLAGGESTVELREPVGKGGRNQEAALSAAFVLRGAAGVAVLCCGSDGIDGPTDAAGAIVDGQTWDAIAGAGRDPARDLACHDAYSALDACDALVRTGATGTNVMDVALAWSAGSGGTRP